MSLKGLCKGLLNMSGRNVPKVSIIICTVETINNSLKKIAYGKHHLQRAGSLNHKF